MPNRYDIETEIRSREWAKASVWSTAIGPIGLTQATVPADLVAISENIMQKVDAGQPVTVAWAPGSQYYNNAVHAQGRPLDNKSNVGYTTYRKVGDDQVQLTYTQYAYYEEPKKSGFFGGGIGGLLGAIVGTVLCPGCAPLTLALAAGGGAFVGNVAGSGAESLITGSEFDAGGTLKSAAITGGAAGVGAGVASALGPSAGVAGEGAAELGAAGAEVGTAAEVGGGVAIGGLAEGSTVIPGIVSASTARALGGISSTLTRASLDALVGAGVTTPANIVQTSSGRVYTLDGLDLVTAPAAGPEPRAIAGAPYMQLAGATPGGSGGSADRAPADRGNNNASPVFILIVLAGGVMLWRGRHGA